MLYRNAEYQRPIDFPCPRCSAKCKVGSYTINCSGCNVQIYFSDYELKNIEHLRFTFDNDKNDVLISYTKNKTYINGEYLILNYTIDPSTSESKLNSLLNLQIFT